MPGPTNRPPGKGPPGKTPSGQPQRQPGKPLDQKGPAGPLQRRIITPSEIQQRRLAAAVAARAAGGAAPQIKLGWWKRLKAKLALGRETTVNARVVSERDAKAMMIRQSQQEAVAREAEQFVLDHGPSVKDFADACKRFKLDPGKTFARLYLQLSTQRRLPTTDIGFSIEFMSRLPPEEAAKVSETQIRTIFLGRHLARAIVNTNGNVDAILVPKKA